MHPLQPAAAAAAVVDGAQDAQAGGRCLPEKYAAVGMLNAGAEITFGGPALCDAALACIFSILQQPEQQQAQHEWMTRHQAAPLPPLRLLPLTAAGRPS